MATNPHIIDAKGKRLGRIATQAAHILMGKNSTGFERHQAADVTVSITNAKDMHIEERKRKQKKYVRYSGYPGGKKEEKLDHLLERRGIGEIIKRAVYGMLPANKLRKKRMENLTIEE